MSLEKLIQDINDNKQLISSHTKLIDGIKYNGTAAIATRGNWSCSIPTKIAIEIIEKQLGELQAELDKLVAAKDAAEKTARGWLQDEQQ